MYIGDGCEFLRYVWAKLYWMVWRPSLQYIKILETFTDFQGEEVHNTNG